MPKSKRAIVLFLCVFVLLGAGGCDFFNRGGQARPGERPLAVAYSIADERRDGNQVIKRLVQARAGTDERVRITWRDAEGDARRQERDVEQFIKQKVDAVVIQFVEPQMGPGIVRRLAMNRIRVVALETFAPDAPLDGYVASEQVRAGEHQARYVVRNRPAGAPGRVLVLGGDPADPISRNIIEGITTFMEGQPGFTVELREHPQGDPGRAAAGVREALAAGPLGAVLAVDSRMAVGAVEVLRQRGLLNEVLTVGVGADRTAAEALVAGDHDAEVDVRPDLLAQFSYDAAVGLARNGHWAYETQITSGDYTVPARMVPVRLVQGNNAFLLRDYYGDLTRGGGQQGGGQGRRGGEDGQEGQGQQQGGGEQQGQGQQQQPMTRLIIRTQDGKTVEIDIPGQIQSIEAQQEGGGRQGGVQGQGGGQGGSQGGGQ